ncbi:MAG: ABC transporter permease, partial [Oscillospiraceae bacterium]
MTSNKKMSLWGKMYWCLFFSFMYVPIVVLMVFSFNESKSRSLFTGFTFKWYKQLFQNEMILKSFAVSIVIALVSSILVTIIGTAAAVGINSLKKWQRSVIMNISYMPIINPEIITGVSLMLLF